MLRYQAVLVVAALAPATLGCNSGDSAPNGGGQSEMDRMAQELEQENAAKQRAAADAEAAKQTATPTPVEEPARIGDSDQNREETSNPLLAAGHAYVFAENRATVWQHQSAIKNYHAEHGSYPESHEEYIEKIVERELVILPPPDEGYEYWYRSDDPMQLWLRPVGSGDTDAQQP